MGLKPTEEKYITTLINLQMTLESLSHLVGTEMYQHKARKRINQLENDLYGILKRERFEEMYLENEKTFAEYIKHVEYISKWIVDNSFKDVMTLGAALNKGELRFEDKE